MFDIEQRITSLILGIVLGLIFIPLKSLFNHHNLSYSIYSSICLTLTRKLNRDNRAKKDVYYRASFLAIIVITFSISAGILIERTIEYFAINPKIEWLTSSCLYALIVPVSNCLFRYTKSTKDNDFAMNRKQIAKSAMAFNIYIISAALYFIFAGFAGLLLIIALYNLYVILSNNLIKSESKVFTLPFRHLIEIMLWIPNRISALFIISSALFTAGTSFKSAIKALKEMESCKSIEAIALTSVAGALKTSIMNHDFISTNDKPMWYGLKNNTAKTSARNIKIAFALYLTAIFIFLAALSLISLPLI